MILKTGDDINLLLSQSLSEDGILLTEEEIAPEFFDLKTRIAGELFQKFVNYRSRLAIVVKNPQSYGKHFSELVYEHRSHPSIRFFPDRKSADNWLTGAH